MLVHPIFSRERRVLGAFALYYDQVRSPDEREKRLVQIASDLAAIAIERDMADRRLEAGTAGGQFRQDTGTPAYRKLSAREREVFHRIARANRSSASRARWTCRSARFTPIARASSRSSA